MFFLNLALSQLLVLAGFASVTTIALYLLDRSRRRRKVSTLQFWSTARQPIQTSRRRHLRQPWSLILQLLGVLLLLGALAQPRFGNPFAKPGYDVLVLETSAWMAARDPAGRSGGTLMDAARRRALQWLALVPPADRVMLIYADSLATPATAFESDRHRVAEAIAASSPGATALDLDAALRFAQRAQSLQSGSGEIAFVGSGRITEAAVAPPLPGTRLRAILIPDAIENVGLRRISAKRAATDDSQWEVLVGARNYGHLSRSVTITLGFDGTPVASRSVLLPPSTEKELPFSYASSRSGTLEARITPGDAFPEDNRATLALPALPVLAVTVYSTRPEILRPFLAANPRVKAEFRLPAQYHNEDRALVILDRFRPAERPAGDAIWVDPPAAQSPAPIRQTVSGPRSLRWITNHLLGAGLRAHDARLQLATVFAPISGDIRVAEINEGPVIVARPGTHKTVLIGFDPAAANLRFELSTPIAFANILRWIDPDAFRQSDLTVQSAGVASFALDENSGDPEADAASIKATREDGTPVPFTLERNTLHLFSGTIDKIRVTSGDREFLLSLTLPELAIAKWNPPQTALRGVPSSRVSISPPREIWPWLALLGGVCLLADWMMFGHARRSLSRPVALRPPLRRAS